MNKSNYTLQPVHATEDGVFNTVSGRLISLINPTTEMIDISDIAHALSLLCRFGGHIPHFYSVAQHSIFTMMLARIENKPIHVQFACLMHDATEAYVQDVIKPLKVILGSAYEDIERRFECVIMKKYGISDDAMKATKSYDRQALGIEHDFFFKGGRYVPIDYGPQMFGASDVMEDCFMQMFKQLRKEMSK